MPPIDLLNEVSTILPDTFKQDGQRKGAKRYDDQIAQEKNEPIIAL